MKKTKHRISRFPLFAAAALLTAAPAVSMPVLAAEVSDTSIDVANASEGTYNLYQLFTGDYADTGSGATFGNIKVNPAYKEAILNAVKAYDPQFKLDGTEDNQSNQLAEAIARLSETQGFANTLAGYLSSAAPTRSGAAQNNEVSLPVSETGYYLVASDIGNKTLTSGILVPVSAAGTVNVQLKASAPVVTKQVAYANTTEFGKYTQAGLINGAVQSPTYQIRGTLNNRLFDYPAYHYEIKDSLPAGITTTLDEVTAKWNVSVKAYKNENDTAGTVLSPVTTVNENVLTWTFDDLKSQLTGWTNEDAQTGYVEVLYTPVYDEADINAIYSQPSTLAAPQKNSVEITYSKNPYNQTELDKATSTTAPDTASVYSFNLNLKKVTLDDKGLKGAAFTLTDESGITIGNEITADENGVFVWTGLEAGKKYTLTETTVPAGYKKIDPVQFTLSMNPNTENTEVISIAVEENADPSNAAVWGSAKDADQAVFESATADVYIGNAAGPNMPSTGQSGIVIATAAGLGILTLSAVAILKKKKESQN